MKKMTMLATAIVAVASMIGAASAGAAGSSSMKPSGVDQAWIEEAVRIDLSEISAGKLALKQASNGNVKALGQRLMSAHSKSITKDEAVAKKAGAGVPTALTSKQKAVAKLLKSKKGAAFDAAYPAAEVKGHMEAIKGAKLEIANGSDSAVIAIAKTDLKMYEMHLKWAKAAEGAAAGK